MSIALVAGLGCGGSGAPTSMSAHMDLSSSSDQAKLAAEQNAEFNTEAYDALPENRFVNCH